VPPEFAVIMVEVSVVEDDPPEDRLADRLGLFDVDPHH
jgi:hypothetical protein